MTDTNTAQMVADLQSTNSTVQGNSWVSPELGGGGALGMLDSMADPLTALAGAGLGWFMPLVSFLGDGLSQLQGGSSASVTSGSQDFSGAGQNVGDLSNSFQGSVDGQTTSWSGQAATDYRNTATQAATGVAGLGTGSSTVGSSIIGAGQVVAQAISEITELIGEAVSQIVPILTTAISQAQETMGQSVVAAIPPCVGIAVKTAAQIASKLAALLASGQNLLKLVQGALGVVDLIQQALSSISQQSTQGGTDPTQTSGADQAADPASTGNTLGAADSGADGATAPMSADSGATPDSSGDPGNSGDSPDFGGSSDPGDSANLDDPANLDSSPNLDGSTALSGAAFSGANPMGFATQSAAIAQPFSSTLPANVGGGQVPSGSFPVGAAGMGLAAGARSGAAGGDTARQGRRLSPPTASTDESGEQEAFPMSGARRAGDTDKEHKRKYSIVEQHEDEIVKVAPPVIG